MAADNGAPSQEVVIASFIERFAGLRGVIELEPDPLTLRVRTSGMVHESVTVHIEDGALMARVGLLIEGGQSVWPDKERLDAAWSLLEVHLDEVLDTCDDETTDIRFGPDGFTAVPPTTSDGQGGAGNAS